MELGKWSGTQDIGGPLHDARKEHMSDNYEEIGARIGALVDKKNAAYGNAVHDAGKVMRVLYPNGIRADQMDDALAIVRILDKMFRIANKKTAFGENPFEDIAGYGILKCRDDHQSVSHEKRS